MTGSVTSVCRTDRCYTENHDSKGNGMCMKAREGFLLRKIGGDYVIVPTGMAERNVQGLITVNEVGAFLWKMLQAKEVAPEELVKSVLDEYDVDEKIARTDIQEFLSALRQNGMLEE